MKRLILCYFIFSSILCFSQLPGSDKNWNSTPTFQDEFTGVRSWNDNRVDNTGKWRAYFAASGVTHGENERQVYQRENAIFQTTYPGYMIFKAEYEPNNTSYWDPYNASPNKSPYNYVSGAIETLMSFKYGYFEIRCTLPSPNYGNFPAFWLWSHTNRYNEIDVFEHVIYKENYEHYKKHFFASYFDSNAQHNYVSQYTLSDNESPLTNFHTYAIEWFPNELISYFDGKVIGVVTNDPKITDQYMNIDVNYALYKDVDVTDNSQFPLEMKIDYVKVYNLKCDCERSVLISNTTDMNNYSHSLKKNITIGNGTNIIKISNGNNISLRATESVTINGDFEVPAGCEFYITTHPCPQ